MITQPFPPRWQKGESEDGTLSVTIVVGDDALLLDPGLETRVELMAKLTLEEIRSCKVPGWTFTMGEGYTDRFGNRVP